MARRENRTDDPGAIQDILSCLDDGGPLSRAAIAKQLDLSRTTVSNLMTRLIELRLVRELPDADVAGRGRPGIPVETDTDAWYALGAEYNSRRWLFALVTLKGDVALTDSVEPADTQPKSVVAALTRGIRAMRKKTPGRLLGAVGLGVPGVVDWEKGSIVRADDLGWENIAIARTVEKSTGLSAYVLNRNRAAGVAEARYGQGRDVANFIYIGVGTGISAAIMLSGDLVHGCNYSAGEIGHLTVDPYGPLCRCGKRGCLQTMAAEGAVVRLARERKAAGKIPAASGLGRLLAKRGQLRGEAVCALAEAGDKAALACVREAAGYLGRTVGNLITILNPDKVIIGGPLARDGGTFASLVREQAAEYAMPYPFSGASVEPTALDEYAAARGAAWLVLANRLELAARGEQ